MDGVFKKGMIHLTHNDLGLTEDEYNNWLIDIFTQCNSSEFPVINVTVETPPTTTITITNHKYLDLEEGNN